MSYIVSKAEYSSLPEIENIYHYARRFMAENGNPTQWGDDYPSRELLKEDIDSGKLYVICSGTGIHGVFYFDTCEDPTYQIIYNGGWHCGAPYGVIHRIAGDGSGGILSAAVEFAKKRISHLRIDTHADNYIMQRAIAKQGFRYCGIIYVEDGTPRLAYDFIA